MSHMESGCYDERRLIAMGQMNGVRRFLEGKGHSEDVKSLYGGWLGELLDYFVKEEQVQYIKPYWAN